MSSQYPNFSVIIPTHDRNSYLREALSSVASQVIRPYEVVVVDDLGSNEVALLVERFTADLPIRYLDASHLPVKGAGASRNYGAIHARGSHLAFLDDDDLWRPDFLQKCLGVFSERNPEMVVTWSSFLANERELQGHSIQESLTPENIFHRNPGLTGSNFVISKSAFVSLDGFDESLWVSNDRDFLIRFLDKKLSYGTIQGRLVLQRIHSEGQLTNRTERRAAGIATFFAKYENRLHARDRRMLLREIYSIRRISSEKALDRWRFVLLQLLSYRGAEILAVLQKKALRGNADYK